MIWFLIRVSGLNFWETEPVENNEEVDPVERGEGKDKLEEVEQIIDW